MLLLLIKFLTQPMLSTFTHTHRQSVLAKYNKRLSRLRKSIREGSFSRYTVSKKRQLFQCIARYERQLRLWGIATAATCLLPSSALQAQAPLPIGSEFKANTYTTSGQSFPAIAMSGDGHFVVAWTSFAQDGYVNGIYAQRYDNAGVPQGSEFKVHTYTTETQRFPAIAMDTDGDFVIAWESSGQDGSNYGVYAQRYNNAGVAQGSEFRVNTYTTNLQRNISIAMDSDGDFVITWQSRYQDGDEFGIYAQRYDNVGVPQGGEFQVNTYTTGRQANPSIGMDDVGNFVIGWQTEGPDGHSYGIYAQRYDNAGIPQGSEFQINTYTINSQVGVSLAMDDDGDFVAAWNSQQDGGLYGVFAQRYDNAGIPQGSEFRVNTFTTDIQRNPYAGMDSDGNFVIAWQSKYQDGSGYGTYAQQYNAAGIPQGAELRVNTYTTSDQWHHALAVESNGDFVVTWDSNGQDGNSFGIYAQRYMYVPLLPIELLFFTGHAEPDANIVEWATATEKNSAWVIVERSPNGADEWTEIGRTAGAGNSTNPISYKISDVNPLPLAYYRLVSEDFDGSVAYSEVISIRRLATDMSILNVFPLPAGKEVSLVVDMPASGAVDVSVHNMLGQLVWFQKSTLEKGSNDVKIDLQDLPAGNYSVTIANGVSRVVKQVLKQ